MKTAKRLTTLLSVSAATAALASAMPAYAQDETARASEASGENEIIVTAQFREQNLQDTPLAISAVNSEMMDAKHQVSISDIAAGTPSVLVTPNANGGGPAVPVIAIRGIGQTDTVGGVEPGVGVYVDDVYYGILNGSVFELVDLDRVEVLRGPQGTLSGKNSLGGSIKLYSKVPDDEVGGSIELTYGSFDRTQVRGSLNIPLIADRAMLRVSGVFRHEEGYVKRLDYRCVNPQSTVPLIDPASLNHGCVLGTAGGQDLAAIRGSLRIVLGDNIENTIIADWTSDHHGPDAAVQLINGPWAGSNDFVTSPGSYTNYAAYVGYPGTPFAYQEFVGNNSDQWGISNKFEFGFGAGFSLTSITAWRSTDAHGGQEGALAPYTPFLQDTEIHHNQFTQELRLSGSIGDLADFTLGGYYYHAHSLVPNHIDILGGVVEGGGIAPGLYLANFRSFDPFETESKSGFAHTVIHLLPDLNLTGGLRYTDESKDQVYHRIAVDNGAAYLLSAAIASLDGTPGSFAGNRWDWRVALDYRFNPNLLVYGQVATGFKGGGVNPRPYFASQAVEYDPESVITYEGGIKSDWFDRRARLNVSAFYSDFKNMQLIVNQCDAISPFPGAPCGQTTNAGDSKIWGLEIEGSLHPVDGLTIDVSGSFLDFEYTSVNPTTGIPLVNTLPFLIRTKLSAGIQYEVPAFGGTLTPRFDVNYQSAFETDAVDQNGFVTPNSDFTGRVPGFTLANARLSYKPDDADWEVAASVQNLFDEVYFNNKFNMNNPLLGYFSAQGYLGKPRTWDVSVKYRF